MTRFQGNDGGLSPDGEVATAMFGFDSRWDRWLAGVVVSYSEGQGAYTHYELNERTSFWGVLGYGVGELSLTPQRSATALSVRTGGRPGADPEHAVQLRGALRW